jgi:hypothetical protein
MDDRLHKALDDELTPDQLAPTLAAELDETRALFGAVVRAIPTRPIPNLGAAVRQRIEAVNAAAPRTAEVRPRRGVTSWLVSPQRMSFSIRPVYALAAAVLVAAVIGIRESRVNTSGNPSTLASGPKAEVLVHFRLEAPRARVVSLAGDFSNWTPSYTLTRSQTGVWTIVIPLAPGVHDYSFIVDGDKWTPDPAAPPIADGFGGTNSRVAVIGPDKRT